LIKEKREELAKIDQAVKEELDKEVITVSEDKDRYLKALKKLMQLREATRKRLTNASTYMA